MKPSENLFHLILWAILTIITYASYTKQIDVDKQLYLLMILYAFVTLTYLYSVLFDSSKKIKNVDDSLLGRETTAYKG
jgi:hypothetical protein